MKNIILNNMERWHPCLSSTKVQELWNSACGNSPTGTIEQLDVIKELMTSEQLVWVVMRPDVLEDSEMLTLSAWIASEYAIVDQYDPVKMRLAAWAVVKIGAASEAELKERWDLLNMNIFNRIVEFAS